MQIKGNIFFVTGGGSGLGLATAKELASKGALVGIMDYNEDSGTALAKELGADRAFFALVDIREENQVSSAIEKTCEHWKGKKVGGVVHCGGVGMAGKTIQGDGSPFPLDIFQDVIAINLTGSFIVARLVAAKIASMHPPPPPAKSESPLTEDRGVIIMTSSVSATEGQMGQVAYASSKAGVEGLVLPMARDLARYGTSKRRNKFLPFFFVQSVTSEISRSDKYSALSGIRVVCIAPSLFATAMGAGTPEKVKKGLLSSTLFPPRFGESHEYAHLAVAIIGNQMLNGSTIRLDGGSRMSKF
ncbi:BZ3500_MvSof-1268-A1-R1_Chr6-3g08987 [Microbotryum saponariae]|uniref:BZ3500_MvSof-1268-A1-R1_Chr6-3g08987 protein n=1 Tax=Microbotryum saponariae TaxID=289078 RepID=A0A2X0LNP2_9BASI|nr:BZ3500_MvSof-1268-A1-R1_Chr6-3g08987 [Microbotryum saponariae]SDA07589.1 BZ3501_MvSof-1269-A2-R1_Chr6-2g08691 [Microbotryum saponariae]